MNPGLLRHRITIERREAGQDCLGQPSSRWEEVGKLWARMMQAKAEPQSDKGDRRVESQVLIFRVRATDAEKILQPGDRISFRGRPYEITGTAEVLDGRGEWVEVKSARALSGYNF